jgi:hypothetical protein
MPRNLPLWSGHEWQDECVRLLGEKYGTGLQQVPDARYGDRGIEAFVRSEGEVFQCHAAQGLAANEIHDAQQSKLTRELRKFTNNRALLVELVGASIRRYVFLVPRFADKRIVEHAAKKTTEIRTLQHEEFDPEFEVVVLSEDQLRNFVGIASVYALPLQPPPSASPVRIAELAAATAKIENIDRKLTLAGIGEPARTTTRAAFLDFTVRMQDFMDAVHADYEETWLAISAIRTHRAERLGVDAAITSSAPNVFLEATIRELIGELSNVPGLDRRQSEVLGYGFAGDWLLECHLDFRVVA